MNLLYTMLNTVYMENKQIEKTKWMKIVKKIEKKHTNSTSCENKIKQERIERKKNAAISNEWVSMLSDMYTKQ